MELVDLDKPKPNGHKELELARRSNLDFFRSISVGNHAEAKRLFDESVIRTPFLSYRGSTLDPAVEGTTTKGGYTVPTEWLRDFYAILKGGSLALRDSRIVDMGSDVMNISTLATRPSVAWYNENTAISSSKPVYGQAVLTANKLAVIYPVANELLQDSVFDLPSQLADIVGGDVMPTEIDNQFFAGTGSPFTGLIGQALTTVFQGDAAASGKTKYTDITWDDMHRLVLRTISPAAMKGASIYIDQNVLAYLMITKASTAGVYFRPSLAVADVLQPAENGSYMVAGTFLGYPVVVVPSGTLIATFDTSAHAGVIHVIFGNLKKTTAIGMRGALHVAVSNDATAEGVNAFTNDLQLWRWTHRLCMTTILAANIGGLKTSTS